MKVIVLIICMVFSATCFAQDYTKEGKAKLKNGDYADAIVLLEKAIEKNNSDTLAYCFLGQSYRALSKNDDAQYYYSIAIQLDSYDPDFHFLKGQSLYETGNNTEALREFAIVDAICKYNENRTRLLIMNDGINIEARYMVSDYYLYYGRALFDIKYYKEALSKFEAANSISGGIESTEKYWRGRTYYELENYEKSCEDLSEADSLLPNNESINSYLGQASYFLGNYDNAIESFTKASKLNPQSDFYLYFIGNSFTQLNQYEKAISFFDKAIVLSPNDTYNIKARGDAYKALGNEIEAQKDYDRAAKAEKQKQQD
jgi:tetratricopeptide (TPR) repeat protein